MQLDPKLGDEIAFAPTANVDGPTASAPEVRAISTPLLNRDAFGTSPGRRG